MSDPKSNKTQDDENTPVQRVEGEVIDADDEEVLEAESVDEYDEDEDDADYDDDDDDDDEDYDDDADEYDEDDEDYDEDEDDDRAQASNRYGDIYGMAESMGASGLLAQLLGGGMSGPELRYSQAYSMQMSGNLEGAADAYLDVIEQNPEHFKAHLALGQTLMLMDEPQKALTFLEKAVDLNPNEPNAWLFLGYAHYSLGELPTAIENFQSSIDLDQTNHVARNNMGYAYYLLDDFDAAEQAFIKAGDFGSERAYYNLGMIRLIQGREAEGWQAYDEADEIDPHGMQIEEHLPDLEAAIEKYPDAAPLLQKAVDWLHAEQGQEAN